MININKIVITEKDAPYNIYLSDINVKVSSFLNSSSQQLNMVHLSTKSKAIFAKDDYFTINSISVDLKIFLDIIIISKDLINNIK